MSGKPIILVTGADLAQEALTLLGNFEIVYTGKAPTEEGIVVLCKQHNPVAIIVRYGKVGAVAMDAAPSLRVISKHGSGTDTIDKAAAEQRCIALGASVPEQQPSETWRVLLDPAGHPFCLTNAANWG